VGDPCHGKYYYRCLARCKKVPTVRETVLDSAVKVAVKKIMTDPEVILEPLRRLDEAAAREAKDNRDTALEIEREAKRLANEEQRILDAYRTGIITPAQLGKQLEKLKDQQVALDLRKSEVQRANVMPVEQAQEAVTNYCAKAASNLANFTDGQWRELLRTIIAEITFHGDRVSIQGRIPINPSGERSGPGFQLDHGLALKPFA